MPLQIKGSRMKLLIHEGRTSGHYLYHVKLIAEAALERGIATELSLSSSAPSTPEFSLHLAPLIGRLGTIYHFDADSGSAVGGLSASASACVANARISGAEHIIALSADGVAPIWGQMAWGGLRRLLPKGMELEVGLIRPTFAHADHRGLRRLKLAAVRVAVSRAPIAALRIADFPAYENIKRARWARRQRLLAVPEPCEPVRRFTRDEARAFLGLPVDGRVVVAPGEISNRKCPLELAEAFVRAAPTDARMLFAGRFVDGLAEKLEQRFGREIGGGRIILLNRLLTDEELDAAIAAADVAAAVYAGNPGPSAIIDRAMMADKPVLTHNYGWANYMVGRFALGWTTDPFNPDAYTKALAAALEGADRFKPSPAAQWLKRFYSMENFRRHWMMRLRERMGLEPEEMVRWEDALRAAGTPN